MEIVLLQTVKKLGRPGEVKKVTRGYAINYLIPYGFALPALPGFIKEAQSRARKAVKAVPADIGAMTGLLDQIKDLKLTVTKKTSKEGKLYGSVKVSDIIDLIEEQIGQEIAEKFVQLSEPIKATGEHTVMIGTDEQAVPVTIEVQGEEVKAEKGAKKAKLKAKTTAKSKK